MLLNCVVLAGGKSSRMGEDKALLPFGGYSSLSEYQYSRMRDIFDRVYISSKLDKFDFKADIIYDRDSGSSPLNALISALEYLKSDIFLISVDMPCISTETIERLICSYKSSPEYDIYVAKSKYGIEPTVAIYKESVLDKAKSRYKQMDFRLTGLIKSLNYLEVEIDREEEFINLNFKEDYLKVISKY